MNAPAWLPGAGWCLAGLVLTLVLAARLTPRGWWRRPNLRALAVLGGGTLAFGALFAALFGTGAAAPRVAAPVQAPLLAAATLPEAPMAGAAYRVVDELNLRSERSVGGRRLAVLPAGTLVAATGAAHGDWWQVRTTAGGQAIEGWASSLWLRRADEGRRGNP
jgi:hypothetical protein